MKELLKIKKWQLLRARSQSIRRDLSGEDFLTVGKRAFWGDLCEVVILPRAVSTLKAEAFYHCTRLSKIVLSTENNVGLSKGVFRTSPNLLHVENSEMLSYVGERAFENCTLLSKINFGRYLRRVGERAFFGCRSLSELTLGGSIETIGHAAFSECTSLEKLDISELRVGAESMFRGCLSLSSVEIPAAWQELSTSVFRDCTSLCEVLIPSNITKIGASSFRGCTSLSSVTVDLGVSAIGAFSFADNPNLSEVYLPHSIKKLGFGAFGLGKSEKKITIFVENEYTARSLRTKLFLCGSSGRTEVVVTGKSIEERKRERRSARASEEPVHLVDFDAPHYGQGAKETAMPIENAPTCELSDTYKTDLADESQGRDREAANPTDPTDEIDGIEEIEPLSDALLTDTTAMPDEIEQIDTIAPLTDPSTDETIGMEPSVQKEYKHHESAESEAEGTSDESASELTATTQDEVKPEPPPKKSTRTRKKKSESTEGQKELDPPVTNTITIASPMRRTGGNGESGSEKQTKRKE